MSIEDLIRGFRALEDAAPGYRRAEQYYEGELPERFASDHVRAVIEKIEANGHGYRFRLAQIPVNAMANRLRISSVSTGREDQDRLLEQIRQANDMEILERHLILRTLVYGDAYAMVWPVDRDSDATTPESPIDREVREAGVEIHYLSPLHTRAMYDTDTSRNVRYVIRRWREADPADGPDAGERWYAELWYLDRLERWRTVPDATGLDPAEWSPYVETDDGTRVTATPGENWPESHDLGELPIKHARTGLPYGRPEHVDAYGPQDAITKALITQVADVEEHGWPERVRIADDAKALDTGRDAVRWDDDALAPPHSWGEISVRERGPGKEQVYYGTRNVFQIDPPDPNTLISPVDQWVRLMATVTETPFWEFDPITGSQLSGVARDRADAPMRAKERNRKTFLLRFFREVYGLALRVAGQEPAGPIQINWSPPDVISDPEWWTTAQIRSGLGVPTEKILQEANYLPEEIEMWLDEQGEGATLDQRIARLQALGEALQAIGAGAALLGIEPNVMDMVSRILQEGGGDPLPDGFTSPQAAETTLPPARNNTDARDDDPAESET